jgi:hypothetical protein
MDKEFGGAYYRAKDGDWRIYDEPSDILITNISTREKLDEFTAEGRQGGIYKTVRLTFTNKMAEVTFEVPASDHHWLEHFMLDLNKHIRKPSLLQRFGGFPIPLVLVGGAFVIPIQQPYCKINIKPKQANPQLIGIGGNIAASIIYDLLKVMGGFILAFIAAWVLRQFGFDIFKWLGLTGGS